MSFRHLTKKSFIIMYSLYFVNDCVQILYTLISEFQKLYSVEHQYSMDMNNVPKKSVIVKEAGEMIKFL